MINKFLANPLGAFLTYIVITMSLYALTRGESVFVQGVWAGATVIAVLAGQRWAQAELRRKALPRPAGFTIVISEADLARMTEIFQRESGTVESGLRTALAAASIEVRG
jgi:hypothetical protein